MSDDGWRRGDEAAWWDAAERRWRTGRLVHRRTVPTYEYDVETPRGTVSVPERMLRSLDDPAVKRTPEPPPFRTGESLADRTRR